MTFIIPLDDTTCLKVRDPDAAAWERLAALAAPLAKRAITPLHPEREQERREQDPDGAFTADAMFMVSWVKEADALAYAIDALEGEQETGEVR